MTTLHGPAAEQHQHRGEVIANSLQALERHKLKQSKDQAAAKKDMANAVRALRAPIESVIMKDPAASHALKELRQHRFVNLPPLTDRLTISPSASSAVLSLQLGEHISLAAPPYDYEWQWGNPESTLHQRATGDFGITGLCDSHHEDPVYGEAGIGFILTTDKPAFVNVRPYIQFQWHRIVGSKWWDATAWTSGGIVASAFDHDALIAGVRKSLLFSANSDSGEPDSSDEGVVWCDDVALSFMMDSNQAIAVNYGAYIDCGLDDSWLGAAGAGGHVQANVKWVVVQRFIAG